MSGEGKIPKPYYQDDFATIYHGNCREILPLLPKVDLVLTDPPYGIGCDSSSKIGNKSRDSYSGGTYGRVWGKIEGDDKRFEPEFLLKFPKLILWGANHYASRLPDSGGWLVWDKKRFGETANGYRGSDCELAWTNILGSVKIKSFLWDGFKRDGEVGEHYHPTQKPKEVMKWCLNFFPEAQTILDPFMGSGTTLRAAKDLRRKSIGIEISESYCKIAVSRLRQEVLI